MFFSNELSIKCAVSLVKYGYCAYGIDGCQYGLIDLGLVCSDTFFLTMTQSSLAALVGTISIAVASIEMVADFVVFLMPAIVSVFRFAVFNIDFSGGCGDANSDEFVTWQSYQLSVTAGVTDSEWLVMSRCSGIGTGRLRGDCFFCYTQSHTRRTWKKKTNKHGREREKKSLNRLFIQKSILNHCYIRSLPLLINNTFDIFVVVGVDVVLFFLWQNKQANGGKTNSNDLCVVFANTETRTTWQNVVRINKTENIKLGM